MNTSTIPKLLNTKLYRHNQTILAKDLSVNRSTLRRYMKDEEGTHHFVKVDGDALELYTNQTNKAA